MKKTSISAILLLSTIHIAMAQLRSQVNECFELTSIVFRLAGAKEYVNNNLSDYTSQVDHYFAEHKDHRLIPYIKEIREKDGIGYDAVMVAASFLNIRDGRVVIKSDLDITQINEVDKRWTEQSYQTFVDLLNDFYGNAKFRDFYVLHAGLYRVAEERMDEALRGFNFDWFKSLFGNDIQSPLVIVSLCNGPNNYAVSIPAKNRINGMVIGCATDKNGLPAFSNHVIYLITHEFLHNYTNPRIVEYWNQIDSAAQKIHSHVEADMYKLAYGSSQTTMYEWFTNLCSIMYTQDNPIKRTSTNVLIKQHHNMGFIWMERSIHFMEHFRSNRDLFATIDDFMPQIAGFINQTAANFDQVLNEQKNRHPYIVDAFPAPGSIIRIDMDTIKIRFSEPMFDAHGMKPVIDKDILPVPREGMPFWQNEYTFVVLLDKSKIEKGKSYGFKLDRQFFQSEKTYSMKEDYTYTFETSDE